MDKLKQWVSLTVVAVLVILAAGWFLLVSPKRSKAASIRGQVATQLTANTALKAQLTILKAQSKDLPRQQAKLAAGATKIPDNPAQPALIRSLVKVAAGADVELVSVSPSVPAALAGAVDQANVGAGELKTIGISIVVSGGYFHIQQFLDGVERLGRAVKVSNLTLTPGENPVKKSSVPVDSGKVLVGTITTSTYMVSGRVTTPSTPAGVKP